MCVDQVSLNITTATKTVTRTFTVTPTITRTYTITPTLTVTPTATPSATITPTYTPSLTATPYFAPPGEAMAFPNPVTKGNQVFFSYSLTEPANIMVDIYNLAGVRVAHLEDRNRPALYSQAASWDITGVAPGIYLYKVTTDSITGKKTVSKVKKLVIAR